MRGSTGIVWSFCFCCLKCCFSILENCRCHSYVLLVFRGVQISQSLESMLCCGTLNKRSNDSNFFSWTTWKICSRTVDSSFSRGSVRKCSSDSIRWNRNICRCCFFFFCLLSRSLFCFIKPPVWFGCFTFTLLFYNNARPLLSSFLFSIFKYFIFVLHVKPCIIFSFLLFLPLAWFTQSLSSSFSHVSIDKCLKAILSRPFIYMPTVHRCTSALPCSKALIYLSPIFTRTFFSRYSRNDLVSGLLWFKEQF